MRRTWHICGAVALIGWTAGCAVQRDTSIERAGVVAARGSPVTLVGSAVPRVGSKAPGFTAVGVDMTEVSLDQYSGNVVILATVPSLDTAVCDREARTFNERASSLADSVVVLVVSKDLPFAQKRWCAAAGIDRIVTLSDSKRGEVGDRYGLLVRESGLLARSVTAIDRSGVIVYQEIVPELSREPDYDAALAAAKRALAWE